MDSAYRKRCCMTSKTLFSSLFLMFFSHYDYVSSSDSKNLQALECFSNVNDAFKYFISPTQGEHYQESITKQWI